MAINTMGAPSYAPVRQDTEVIRTNAEYEQMRAAAAKKARDNAIAAKKKAQQESGYYDIAHRLDNAPSVAEIMAETGASAKDAVYIRNRQLWDNYTPEGGWGQKDLTGYQQQINAADYAPKEFDWKWSEPETPGVVRPIYKNDGSGEYMRTAWSFQSPEGYNSRVHGVGGGADKDEFYKAAMAAGVGQAGLDQFARDLGGANWATLDWNRKVNMDSAAWNGTPRDGGTYLGYGNTYLKNPDLWGGDGYILRPNKSNKFSTLVSGDGTSQSVLDVPGLGWDNYEKQQKWWDAINGFRGSLQPINDMNADFSKSMDQRAQTQTLANQSYDSLVGNGLFGGLINDNYSNPWFGQITGREAPQSVFTTPEPGPYPWSSTSPQLDVSSLLAPGYGGPSGGGSMGSYGGAGGVGGLGGLGGKSFGQGGGFGGPFGAKNPWSPS